MYARKQPNPSLQVYVTGFPHSTTPQELRRIFIAMGFRGMDVTVNTKVPKPFAFVTFLTPDDVTRALAADGQSFGEEDESFQLTVSTVREKPNLREERRGGEAANPNPTPAAGGGWGQRYSQNHAYTDREFQGREAPNPNPNRAVGGRWGGLSGSSCSVTAGGGAARPSPQLSHTQEEIEHAIPAFNQLQPRNPNNMFGQLLVFGRKNLKIREDVLVKWLKEYTVLPHIFPVAENPTHNHIAEGCTVMTDEISPGAVMFRNVRKYGLSPETVGWMNFQKIMGMNHPPQNDHIWALPSCPPPRELQGALYFKKFGELYLKQFGELNHVCCFVAGMCFHPDGSTAVFSQEPSSKKHSKKPFHRHNPNHMIGMPALVWTTTIGEFKHCFHPPEDKLADARDRHQGCGNIFYAGREVISRRHLEGSLYLDYREADLENRLQMDGSYVLPCDRNELPCDDEFLRSDPTYKRLADEAIAQIGGIPVSLCSTLGHEEAERAAEGSYHHGGEEAKPDWGAAAGH